MRIVSIGFFCAEYPIALANALAETNDMTLFLSQQNLARCFPKSSNLETVLRDRQVLDPAVSLHLIDYPTGRYVQKVSMARGVVRAVQSLQPDVVHYQSGGNPWVPLVMPWLRRFPLVATIHDALTHPGDRPPRFVMFAVNLVVTRMAHQIIVHGQPQADILLRTYRTRPDKVNVIPMGGFDMFKVLAKEQVTPSSRVVLFFGRLRAYKGLEVLIRAAPLIAARVPDVRFVIAGLGECPSVHQAAAEHPDWFEVHNRFIEAEEVPRFFQRAALVVQPYLEASQSGVLPVAYLFGRPVVATRVGSIPGIVDHGKTGYLVEPGDERALAEAVIRLLQDADRREAMGRAAAAKLEQDLSWDAIAAKTLEVYQRARACASQARPARKEVS